MTIDQLSLIALGANMPVKGENPDDTLPRALRRLNDLGIAVAAQSRLYRTPCFPAGAGPDFVNAAAALRTDLHPQKLLELLHQVEAEFGRERHVRWGARTLDLDLLACGDTILPDPTEQRSWMNLPPEQQRTCAPDQLILPHPRLQERAFVLVPLRDVAPDWCHPVLGRTVRQMCASLPAPDRDAVIAIA